MPAGVQRKGREPDTAVEIVIVTPAGAGSRAGNRVTAVRWARMLRTLGHRVAVRTAWHAGRADLLLALHARRSAPSIQRFRRRHPARPLIVALTGTDLYRDLGTHAVARRSLDMATLLLTLQAEGPRALPGHWRRKARVVYQSARPGTRLPESHEFQVCVVGHLREEKDPFRCALALSHLPQDFPIRVLHLGRALDAAHEAEARRLMAIEPRYVWRGEQGPREVRRVMQGSRLLVVSSRMEGGANVIAEALALGLPVLASRVPGNVGMLGRDYAGYFPLGDESALATLLARAGRDQAFHALLERQCRRRARLMTRTRERRALAAAVDEALRIARRKGAAGRPSR